LKEFENLLRTYNETKFKNQVKNVFTVIERVCNAYKEKYPQNPKIMVQLEMVSAIKNSISSRNLKAFFLRLENTALFVLISRFLKRVPVPEKESHQTSHYEKAIEQYIAKLNLDYIEAELEREVR
jgi:hypothetical protein